MAKGQQNPPGGFTYGRGVSTPCAGPFIAPGGARVVGRFDRDTIECLHTMDPYSYRKLWPIIVSRLEKAGLQLEIALKPRSL